MPIPPRTLASTPEEHLADHGLLTTFYNAYEGTTPATFATATHNQAASTITSGVMATARLGTGTATNVNFLRGDGTWNTPVASAHTHAGTDITTGVVATARLGTGTATNLNFLRGDGTWNAPVAAAHTHDGADIASGTVAASRLGTGTPSSTNFLRGDGTWQAVTAIAVTSPIGVPLSSFAGANDDARLVAYDNARKTAGSGLHGYPVVLDQSRVYTFNASLAITSGFCMVGGVRPVDIARSSKPIGTQVNPRLSSPGAWLTVPNGDIFGVCLMGIAFDANANTRIIQSAGSNTNLVQCTFRDLSYQNGPGLFGTAAQHLQITISSFEGMCHWNNLMERGFHLGGSDSSIDFTRNNIDSPSGAALMADDQYLVECSSLSKTYVKGMYITADRHSAMMVDGGNNHLTFENCVFEGRNTGLPCFGALVRDSSHYSDYINCTFNYAMTAPASGPNAGDLGYIHFTNGAHNLIGCHTRLANGNTVATTSTVYATGSNTYVNVVGFIGEGNSTALPNFPAAGSQETGKKFKPRVRVVGSATADLDNSVVLVSS